VRGGAAAGAAQPEARRRARRRLGGVAGAGCRVVGFKFG